MRCKFRDQASTATGCQARSMRYTLVFRQWVAKKTRMGALVMVLGLGGGLWFTSEAIAPQLTLADTARLNLTVQSQPNESYETLVSRAETAAKAAAQASFNKDKRVTDVSIIIVAETQAAIAPVLSLKVSRPQWRSSPDDQRWLTYFSSARTLLGFEDLATETSSQPSTSTPARSGQTQTATPDNGIEGVNSFPGKPGTDNPAILRGQPTNSFPGNPETGYPGNTPVQRTNSFPDEPGTANPAILQGQPTNSFPSQPETANPANAPGQTLPPGTGLSPQPAINAPLAPTVAPQLPTPSNNSTTPVIPSISTPINAPPSTTDTSD